MAYNGLNEPILLFVSKSGQLVPAAGLQPGYGPHASLSAARTTLGEIFQSIANVPQGYTFCILENQKPVEYWFTKGGGWYVEKKCKGEGSESSSSGLDALAIRLNPNTGVLEYTKDGTQWIFIGKVDPVGTINDIKLKIDVANGHLYISYKGGADGTWNDVGPVGGEGIALPQTQIKFDTNGTLFVSYDGGTTWSLPDGNQYQGNKFNEIEFKRLLKKVLKFRTTSDNYIEVSFDSGVDNSWIILGKSCVCENSGGGSGDSKLKKLTIVVADASTKDLITSGVTITVDGNAGSGTNWVTAGTHTIVVTCSGYESKTVEIPVNTSMSYTVELTKDSSVPQASITVIPVDEENNEISLSDVRIYINGTERQTLQVNSGDTVHIMVVGNTGGRYGSVEEDVQVTTSVPSHFIKVPYASSSGEADWKYTVKKVKLQDRAVLNTGGSSIVTQFTANRRNTLTNEVEPLTLIRVYSTDGDSRVSYTGPTPTPTNDPDYAVGSQRANITYPSAQKQYLFGGNMYEMSADFQDYDGNVVTTSWWVYYEGFWNYYLEKYMQDGYPDSNIGGSTILRVDSYCVADPECPGVDSRNNTRYACPIEIIDKDGIVISSGYPKTIYTADGNSFKDYSYEKDSSAAGLENYRNIIELTLTKDPHNIDGNTVEDNNTVVPLTIRQVSQHYPLPGDSYYYLEHSGGYDDYDIMITTHPYELSIENTYDDMEASGEYSSREVAGSFWNGTGQFKNSAIQVRSVEKQSTESSSDTEFCPAHVEVKYGNTLVYSVDLLGWNNRANEVTNFDDFLTSVYVYTEKESASLHTKSENVNIRMFHTMNYMAAREYTVTVQQIVSGKTLTTTWTLTQAGLTNGDGVYKYQALSEEPGSAYFGVYGNHDTSDIKISYSNAFRSNENTIVLTKIASLPSGLEVTPMFRDDGSNYYKHESEPIKVPDESAISWFKVDYPDIPNGANDRDPYRRQVAVYYDDGTTNAPTTNIVFFGQQGGIY